MKNGIVIIGGGQAGAMAAVSLRQLKYPGTIRIIGIEDHLPYQRPPLSKGFLTKEIKQESLYLRSNSYYENNNINIVRNKKVIKIDRQKKLAILDNDAKHRYDKLIITTGSILKKLTVSCKNDNIHYLRNIEDSLKLKSSLNNKESMVIVGAGYIGLEISSIAIKKGLKVTIVESDQQVMMRSVSKITSKFFQEKHESMGVTFKLGASVIDIRDKNNKKEVVCDNKEIIETDCVVIGIGVNPNIELAMNSGLECSDGIVVDENGKTSDDDIYAAGDCTYHHNKILNQQLRLESVQNAIEQSQSVANSIVGIAKPYNKIPWFWSDQYNIKLKMAGISNISDNSLVLGNPKEEKFTVLYFSKNKLVALDAINDQKKFMIGKKLIESKKKLDKTKLKEKKINLKDCL